MGRRRRPPAEVESVGPLEVAAATPDEEFNAAELLVFDRVRCGSFEALSVLQEARRQRLNTAPR